MKNSSNPIMESCINARILQVLNRGLASILKMGCSCAVDISPFYSSADTQNSFWRGVYAFSADTQKHFISRKLLTALLTESYASIECYFNIYLHPLMTFFKVDDVVNVPSSFNELLPVTASNDAIQLSVDKLLPKIDSILGGIDVSGVDISTESIDEMSCSYFFDSNCNSIEALIISENSKARRLRVGDTISYDKLRLDYCTIARLQHLTLRKLYDVKNQSVQFIYPLNSSSIGQQVNTLDFFDDAMDDSYLGGIWIYVFKEVGEGQIAVNEIKNEIDNVVNALRLEIVPTLFGAKMRFAEIRENRRIREANTKSAIGSIMSRNGSHNIGSHVLAALSHNVGTMPDDRVLYQYIQQRMDYMASATTDFQDWSVPTAFVGELMKQFYSQYHLLEHIAGSEGLHAYRYQGKPLSLSENNVHDYHCIKLNVRSIDGSEKEGYKRCVVGRLPCGLYDFFEPGKRIENWGNDVAVAMPGGVLGQHAFYNIVENIIRNAAKHSWPRRPQGKSGNLDIYIDFADGDFGLRKEAAVNEKKEFKDQIRQMVSVTIGDGLSLIFDNKDFWKRFFSAAGKYVFTDTPGANLELWHKFASVANIEAQKCKDEAINDLEDYFVERGVEQSLNDQRLDALKRAFALPISAWDSDGKCNAVRKFIEPDSMMSPDDLPVQYRVLYAYLLNKVQPVSEGAQAYTGRWGIEVERCGVIPLAFLGGDPKDASHFRNRLLLPLHHRQEIELSKPFINRVSNKLRQSGWGLAEMKISAGYLRREKPSVIGGLTHESKYDLPLVVPMGLPPVELTGQNVNKVPFDLLDLRLAYRIWIERPKKVLVLVDEHNTDWSGWEPAKDPKSGCAVKQLSDALDSVGLMSDFGVVVVDSCSKFKDEDWNKLPFRSVVAVDGNVDNVKSDYPIINRTNLYTKRGGNKVDDFVDEVYDAWLSFLRKCRGKKEGDLSIKLNIYEDSGKEKGLISDIDIYRMLFRECLHSVVEPLVEDLDLTEVQRKALLLISVFPFEISKEVFKQASAIVSEGRMLSLELFRLWVKQVESFLYDKNAWSESFKRFIKCGVGVLASVTSEEKRVEHIVQDGLQNSQNTLLDPDLVDSLRGDLCFWLENCSPDSEFTLLKMIKQICNANILDPLIARIVNAIEAARVTSDVFLRKYEERIVTLPTQYQISKVDKSCNEIPFENLHLKIINGTGKADISYNRHAIDGALLYSEPLSGSQSYLNSLANIKQGDNELAMRLAETGLLRIVIIDERVCSFVTSHDFMRPIYESMRIAVVDTEKSVPVVDGRIDFSRLEYVAGTTIDAHDGFELLIIHQGIIDKWWPNHTKEDVKMILSGLRGRHDGRTFARFVVVTTGRGRPDNIPDDEKVLPFSSIESLLFRRYPEKMTLVNTVMNVLPYEKERND